MLYIYDRFETKFEGFGLAVLWDDVIDPRERWKLNREHLLEFQYPIDNPEAEYIVGDNFVKYNKQIFIIRDPKRVHNPSGKRLKVTCESILTELLEKHIREISFQNNTLQEMLDIITQGTRIRFNVQNIHGLKTIEEETENAYEAALVCISEYNAEYESPGLPDKDGFFNVVVKQEIGRNRGIQVRYAKNLKGIEHLIVDRNIATRIYFYGREGLTFEAVHPKGLPYLDAPNIDDYPRPKELSVTWGNVQSPQTLFDRAQEYMSAEKPYEPKMSYKVDFTDLSEHPDYGKFEKLDKGDTTTVINEEIDLNIKARAVEFEKPLKAPEQSRIILANFVETIIDSMNAHDRTTRTVNRVTVGNRVRTDVLDGAINTLVNQIRASGAYQNAQVVDDGGILLENTDTNSSDYGALYLGPGIFAIASEKTPQGQWNWRTFGTGKGFTADLVTTGSLLANFIRGGELSLGGADNQSGIFRLLNDLNQVMIMMDSDGIRLADGARIMGTQGILSVLKFVSTDMWNGWSEIGVVEGPTMTRGRCSITIPVPSNFEIEKATLTLEAMPVYFNDGSARWKQSRNLRLYRANGNNGFFDYPVPGHMEIIWRSGTNITSPVWGISSWSPSITPSSNPVIQYRSGEIAQYLSPGEETTFYIETTDSPSHSNFRNNQGLGRIIVTIEGFARPEE